MSVVQLPVIAMHTPLDIANWFLAAIDREAGDSITHLKLQKLVYYAQAWSLVLRNTPLFDDDFQAWTHGPVIPNLYDQFKSYGWDALPLPERIRTLPAEVVGVLEDVQRVYGDCSARHLETLTHQELPWQEARGDLPLELRSTVPISKETMRTYYTDLLKQLTTTAAQLH